MKYAGMPFGMWVLFAGSFQKQLTTVLGYDAATARAITKKAKPQYRQIIRRLPEFETNKLPNVMINRRKTIGIRIPDNYIVMSIVEELGNPLLTTSVKAEDEVVEYMTDPELIHEKYEKLVDLVIDGGFGQNVASTVVDCTDDRIEVIRQGIGELK